MTPTTSTVIVTDTCMYLPGRRVTGVTPDTFGDGLTGLTGRYADKIAAEGLTEGVIMVDAYAADRLNLPVTMAGIDDPAEHPAVVDLREAGWQITGLRPWSILYTNATTPKAAGWRPTVHLGVLPWIKEEDPSRCPMMLAGDYGNIVDAFELWRDLIGTAYHGTPGVAGISAMREQATSGKISRKSPRWLPSETGPGDGYERDYRDPLENGGAPDFTLPEKYIPADHDRVLGYDAKRAYLSAMGSAMICPNGLRPTGPDVEWSEDIAGWWLITPAPWQEPRMPDPAGYPKEAGEEKRWVTGPTLALLHELMDEGVHGGYVVHDSYTGPAARVNRPWYERQSKAWKSPRTAYDSAALDLPARRAVKAALKSCYRETNGMLNAPASRIRRPDWHFATIAQARSNLWRRMWRVGQKLDRWPLYIDVDLLVYTTTGDDGETGLNWTENGKQHGIVIGDGLGQFSIKLRGAL